MSNYMDFSDRSHWNGDGVRAPRETQRQYNELRRQRNVKMMKRIREREQGKTFQDTLDEVTK
jgi:hypothetical protein